MPPRKRLGQLLTELGVIDEHQLQSALGHQKQWGGKLGAVLVQKGFCAEEAMVSALAKHLGMPRVRLAEVKVDPRAVKYVSKQIAEKLHVLPYEISGSGRSEVVTIAMSDPTDLAAVDQLAFHTGKRLKPMLAGDGEIVSAIHAHYGGGDEKKEPTDKVARPGAPQAAAPAQGAPAGSVAGFPRRNDPTAAAVPAAGSTRPASYVPPPIPASKPAAPAQKLEEIEPDEVMAPPAATAPAVPPSLDLPEDDGQEFGLEPIAAHSQFGDEVAGKEDVAGDGAAADAVEGLVSASVAYEGATEARQMDGLDAIAAQEPASAEAGEGWTGPILWLPPTARPPPTAAGNRRAEGRPGGMCQPPRRRVDGVRSRRWMPPTPPARHCPRMRSWGQLRSWVRPRRAATRRLRRRQRRPGKRPRRRSRPPRKPVNRSRRRTKPRHPMPGARWTTPWRRRRRSRTLSGDTPPPEIPSNRTPRSRILSRHRRRPTRWPSHPKRRRRFTTVTGRRTSSQIRWPRRREAPCRRRRTRTAGGSARRSKDRRRFRPPI